MLRTPPAKPISENRIAKSHPHFDSFDNPITTPTPNNE